jgi:UDP-GlcNAc:undecaprenyl-phosphate/decaprenyl-phosphate GlcNAc-1-phosphate transferase
MLSLEIHQITVIFLWSLFVGLTIIFANSYRKFYEIERLDTKAVQAAHTNNTSRLGGIAIVTSLIFALAVVPEIRNYYLFHIVGLSLLPIFCVGLAEDLGWRMSPQRRLGAAAISSVFSIIMLETWIPTIGVPYVDIVISIVPLAILLTIILSTAISHAMNLIDGVNGLCAINGILIAAGICAISLNANAVGVSIISGLMIPILSGFLILNWPKGLIFLGDAGAYSIGHLLAWLSIFLASTHPQVSPISLSLLFFWPIADTVLAIARRIKQKRAVSSPDKLHFHQLVMRAILLFSNGRLTKLQANSLTTLILFPLITAPVVSSVIFWSDPYASFTCWLIFSFLFAVSYRLGMHIFKNNRYRKIKRTIVKSFALEVRSLS